MKRTFIMVLDSFGIGAAHDAHKFGDEGSNGSHRRCLRQWRSGYWS